MIVLEDADWPGYRRLKGTNYGHGLVCGPVVENHHFVRQPGLLGDAVELFLKESLPVVRAECNGDFFLRASHSIPQPDTDLASHARRYTVIDNEL